MMLLKISISFELIASKVEQFLERLTSDNLDRPTVEDQVIKSFNDFVNPCAVGTSVS